MIRVRLPPVSVVQIVRPRTSNNGAVGFGSGNNFRTDLVVVVVLSINAHARAVRWYGRPTAVAIGCFGTRARQNDFDKNNNTPTIVAAARTLALLASRTNVLSIHGVVFSFLYRIRSPGSHDNDFSFYNVKLPTLRFGDFSHDPHVPVVYRSAVLPSPNNNTIFRLSVWTSWRTCRVFSTIIVRGIHREQRRHAQKTTRTDAFGNIVFYATTAVADHETNRSGRNGNTDVMSIHSLRT